MKTGKWILTSGRERQDGRTPAAPMPRYDKKSATPGNPAAGIGNRAVGRIAQMAAGAEYDEEEEEDEPPVGQLKRAGEAETVAQRSPEPDGNSTGMPDDLKAGIETLSGMDMSDVRVHSNSAKPAQLGAHAYAQGRNIHLGPGQEKHLPHEAWHVVQQAQGRVRPTAQANGVALQRRSRRGSSGVVQRQISYRDGTRLTVSAARRIAFREVDASDEEINGFVLRYDVDNRVFQNEAAFLAAIRADIAAHRRNLLLLENDEMRDAVHHVSAPSAAHRFELLNSKYAQTAAHTYGYSFCEEGTMATDTGLIND